MVFKLTMFLVIFSAIMSLLLSLTFVAHRVTPFQQSIFSPLKYHASKWSLLHKTMMSTKSSGNSNKGMKRIKYPKPLPGEESRLRVKPKFSEDVEKDRPFTLPPGLFRPKQSLGQNFLSDQNYVMKIINAFKDNSEGGCRVLEIGPGAGALTRKLIEVYPKMTAVEIDQRGYEFLKGKLPDLNIIHMDILDFDWAQAAVDKGGPLSVIANLPYNVVTEVLFDLADNHKAISKAVVTMQLEVAERITAKHNNKDYGIPSVILQLYGTTKLNFKIPPKVFYPQPKVDSALVTIDFTKPHPELHRVDGLKLRKVINAGFRHRRKMLRVSMKELCLEAGKELDDRWRTLRPEQLKPTDFIQITSELFGERPEEEWKAQTRNSTIDAVASEGQNVEGINREDYLSEKVFRKPMYPNMHKSKKQREKLARREEDRAAREQKILEEGGITDIEDDSDDEELKTAFQEELDGDVVYIVNGKVRRITRDDRLSGV